MLPSARAARRLQGAWYVATGAWPLLSLRSFAAVAGPKPDPFQTRVAGMLFLAAGLALRPWSAEEYEDRPLHDDPQRLLALVASAGSVTLAAAHARRLRWTLLAEAGLEAVLAAAAVRGRR